MPLKLLLEQHPLPAGVLALEVAERDEEDENDHESQLETEVTPEASEMANKSSADSVTTHDPSIMRAIQPFHHVCDMPAAQTGMAWSQRWVRGHSKARRLRAANWSTRARHRVEVSGGVAPPDGYCPSIHSLARAANAHGAIGCANNAGRTTTRAVVQPGVVWHTRLDSFNTTQYSHSRPTQ